MLRVEAHPVNEYNTYSRKNSVPSSSVRGNQLSRMCMGRDKFTLGDTAKIVCLCYRILGPWYVGYCLWVQSVKVGEQL